jgi:hypothetical protein
MMKNALPTGLCLFFVGACAQAPTPVKTPALPCSPFLVAAGTTAYVPAPSANLCDLARRYNRVRYKLVKKGVKNPDLLANVFAPRFIDRADWEWELERAPGPVDPALVYEPAPETWNTWARAAVAVMVRGNQNNDAAVLPRLTVEQLKELNATSTAGLVRGEFRRTSTEIGRAMETRYALNDEQVRTIENFEYPNLLTWRNTQCLEERSASFQKNFRRDLYQYSDPTLWPVTKDPNRAYEVDGKRYRCGYIIYPDSKVLLGLVDGWIRDTNAQIAAFAEAPKSQDPILLAARAQRRLVAIHPFDGGNGRTSRLVMDEFLLSLGLPAPLLREMNQDLGHSEEAWAREVGVGILRTVETLEACERDLTAKGCYEVNVGEAKEMPTKPPQR